MTELSSLTGRAKIIFILFKLRGVMQIRNWNVATVKKAKMHNVFMRVCEKFGKVMKRPKNISATELEEWESCQI